MFKDFIYLLRYCFLKDWEAGARLVLHYPVILKGSMRDLPKNIPILIKGRVA